jgi:hypothetical protein
MARDLMHLMRRLFLPAAEAFQEACWRPSTGVHRDRVPGRNVAGPDQAERLMTLFLCDSPRSLRLSS